MRLFIFLCMALFTVFIAACNSLDYHIPKDEQLINDILANTAQMIKNKYDVNSCGAGVSMPGGPIKKVSLCFETKKPLTKEQLRDLLIKFSKLLFEQVNESVDIQPFLKFKPFTIKNVQIIIHNNDGHGGEVFDPGISVARISYGQLSYKTTDKNDVYNYKNVFEETYEEALNKISTSR